MTSRDGVDTLDRPRKFYQDLSIRVWLFLLVLIFALPAGIGVAWNAVSARETARQEAYKNVEIIVGNVASNLDLLLRDYERLLREAAANYQGTPPVAAKNFNPDQIVHTQPLVVSLGVRDLSANPVYSHWTAPTPGAESLKFPWVQQGLHSETFAVSNAFYQQQSSRWVVVLT